MAACGCLATLAAAVSVLVFQSISAEQIIEDLHNNHHYVWCPNENSCGNNDYQCYQPKDGAFESFIDKLKQELRDAEADLANPNNYPPHYDLRQGEEFDFIVVGAGSAGSVVANRLSEVEGWKILLVEAGGNPSKTSEVPGLAPLLQGTDVDWQYKTNQEEENCLGMKRKQCSWPRGRVLGGSSTINYMMHTRGHYKDFDNWAAAGNKGWSYEEVLPYFKKSEDLRDPAAWKLPDADKYHSTGGLLGVGRWDDDGFVEVFKVFEDGYKELGYVYNLDCNGKNLTGFTKMPGAIKDQRRSSTAKAFLSSAKDRKNLFVSKHSLATKILIDIETRKAYGIQLSYKNGTNIHVRAKKEIIVSAGAINSPQLLMLSGVGPKDHLQELGIPIIKDLPVGKNLQDHPLLNTYGFTLNLDLSVPPPTIEDTFNFLLKRPNRLTSMSPLAAAAYINTVAGHDYPDIEILQEQLPQNSKELMISTLKLFNFENDTMEDYIDINDDAYTVILHPSLLRPYSRGRVTLRNTDPNIHPNIVAGTFSDKRDIEVFLRTYDFVGRLVETEALKRVGAQFREIRVSGCKQHPFASAAYRECAMRHLTTTTYHYCGTCKMGPAGDPTVVVDPTLRVHGVEGLRVVDASVMPTITSAHINAPVIMIGEKAADMIKHTWQHV